MGALRAAFRKWIQSTGYDFHKLPGDPGRDPYRDIRRLVGTMSPIVFDVGANTGQTTSAIPRALPGTTVHAFEPHPAAFEGMCRLSMMQKNVVLNNCALGAKPGEQTPFENTSSDMSSLLPLGQDGWGPHLPRLLRAHAVHRKIYAAALGSPFASMSRKCRSIRGHFSKPSCTT